MGACIGKKSSKYHKKTPPPPPPPLSPPFQSNISQPPLLQIQDDTSGNNPSPSVSEILQTLKVTDGPLNNNNNNISDDDQLRMSYLSGISIESGIRFYVIEQNLINEAFSKPLPTQFDSITSAELELELANIILEQAGVNNVENTLTISNDTEKDKDKGKDDI